MKIGLVAVAVLLMVIGIVAGAYSYTRLRDQDVLFSQNSIQIDGLRYSGYSIGIDLDGKYAPKVTGGVGSVGGDIDFYLVNYTSWNSWETDPASRTALSTVHLNATAVSSQSIEGQFSFIPTASTSYTVLFVNDKYPNTNNANVHATITLQYLSVNSLYGLAASLAMLGAGFVLLIVVLLTMTRRKAQQWSLQ